MLRQSWARIHGGVDAYRCACNMGPALLILCGLLSPSLPRVWIYLFCGILRFHRRAKTHLRRLSFTLELCWQFLAISSKGSANGAARLRLWPCSPSALTIPCATHCRALKTVKWDFSYSSLGLSSPNFLTGIVGLHKETSPHLLYVYSKIYYIS